MRRWLLRSVITAELILLAACFVEMTINQRRVAQFRGAWAYEANRRHCAWAADIEWRRAIRASEAAAKAPEGSALRKSHTECAAALFPLAEHYRRQSEFSRDMAKALRLAARHRAW